jgi:hypothetical protein
MLLQVLAWLASKASRSSNLSDCCVLVLLSGRDAAAATTCTTASGQATFSNRTLKQSSRCRP